MAIVKITDFSSGTTPVSGDWSALVNHFNAYTRQISGFQYPVEHISGDNLLLKKGSYIQHGGSLYQVQTEDYTVSGSLSFVIGTYNYIKIEASGETLTATLTQDISSYSWSNIYNYLIASDESQILAFCASSPEANSINIYRLEKKEIQQKTGIEDDVVFNSVESSDITSSFHFPDILTGNTELCSKSGELITGNTHKTYFTFIAACSGTVSVDVSLKAYGGGTAYVIIGDTTYSTTSASYVTISGTIDVIEGNSYSIVFYNSAAATTAYCNSVIVKGTVANPIEKAVWKALNE